MSPRGRAGCCARPGPPVPGRRIDLSRRTCPHEPRARGEWTHAVACVGVPGQLSIGVASDRVDAVLVVGTATWSRRDW